MNEASTEAYAPLLEALRARMEAVADREHFTRDAAGHLERLRQTTEAVKALADALPPQTDPMLRHYLERTSYAKAIDWLEAAVGR